MKNIKKYIDNICSLCSLLYICVLPIGLQYKYVDYEPYHFAFGFLALAIYLGNEIKHK